MSVYLSELGKELRKLRIDHSMLLGDLARILDVSPAFLSNVEYGKKKAPGDWIDKLIKTFNLNDDEAIKIQTLIFDANGKIEIRKSEDDFDDNLVLAFARKMPALSFEEKNEIKKLLEGF